jgi:MFS family permease
MATEGAMFDWSGVYFHDIVKSPEALVTLGYASFMIMMAIGRFIGDFVLQRIGRQRTLQISGVLMFTGMAVSVAFPHIYTRFYDGGYRCGLQYSDGVFSCR